MPPRRTLVMYESGANGFRFSVTLMLHTGERSRTVRGGMRSIRLVFHDVNVYVSGCVGRVGGV